MLKTAILLVGGKALRLRPYTENIPKCMVEVNGRPLIDWIFEWLKENGIRDIILGVAYKKEVIMNYLGDGSKLGLNIKYNDHSAATGTGEAIRLAIENCQVNDENFIAMNGDELSDISLKNLLRFHLEHEGLATIVTAPLRSQFGVVEIDENHTVTNFKEKPVINNKFVNAGIYIFNKGVKEYLPEKGRLEETTFVNLAKERKLKSFKYFGFWNTLNTSKDLENMKKSVENLKI